MGEEEDELQPAGQGVVSAVSVVSEICPGFGSCPLTKGRRAAQQQCPSATQHSISHTSGSIAASVMGTESQLSATASAVAITRILR